MTPQSSAEFCYECAVEIEMTFEIFQVIERRSPETMERIEEIVQARLERERVMHDVG